MNSINKYFFILLLLLLNIPSFSQYSLGLYGSISYGSIYSDSDVIDFNPDKGGGFGIMYYRRSNSKINLVAQVGLEHVEWKTDNFYDYNPPQETFWKRSSVNIFFGANLKLIDTPHLKFGITLLPRLGYVYYQDFIPGLDPQSLSLFIIKKSSLLMGIDTKVDLQMFLTHNLMFHIRPGISTTYFDMERNLQGHLNLDLGLSRSF